MSDEKAVKLLTKACWSSQGWKSKLDLKPEELAYLESAGFSPATQALTHDECVQWALRSCKKLTKEQVSAAFLWSLGTRRLEYRSALGPYAYVHLMPDHCYETRKGFSASQCFVCGLKEKETILKKDFIYYHFERYKWGGVRHEDIDFMALDLESFAKLPPVQPTEADKEALRAILQAAADPKTGKSVGGLKKAIKTLIKTNNDEADNLCQILSFAGILADDEWRGFDGQFIPYALRGDKKAKGDQKYPLNCRTKPGIQAHAVQYWFPGILPPA